MLCFLKDIKIIIVFDGKWRMTGWSRGEATKQITSKGSNRIVNPFQHFTATVATLHPFLYNISLKCHQDLHLLLHRHPPPRYLQHSRLLPKIAILCWIKYTKEPSWRRRKPLIDQHRLLKVSFLEFNCILICCGIEMSDSWSLTICIFRMLANWFFQCWFIFVLLFMTYNYCYFTASFWLFGWLEEL